MDSDSLLLVPSTCLPVLMGMPQARRARIIASVEGQAQLCL